jgi:hypothetical protein
MVSQRKLFKDFPHKNIHKNGFPYSGPTHNSMDHDFSKFDFALYEEASM